MSRSIRDIPMTGAINRDWLESLGTCPFCDADRFRYQRDDDEFADWSKFMCGLSIRVGTWATLPVGRECSTGKVEPYFQGTHIMEQNRMAEAEASPKLEVRYG